MMTIKKKIKAYALLEAVIALGVAGVMMAGLMPWWQARQHMLRQERTRSHQEQVKSALIHYVLLHKRLPCPVPWAYRHTGIAPEPGACEQTYIGAVPFRTLGIGEGVAKDGSGRWLVYGAQPELTRLFKHLEDPSGLFDPRLVLCLTLAASPPALQVLDRNNQNVLSDSKDYMAWVIMALPENGELPSSPLPDQGAQGNQSLWASHRNFLVNDLHVLCKRNGTILPVHPRG